MTNYRVYYNVTCYMACEAEVEADSEEEAKKLVSEDFYAEDEATMKEYDDFEIDGIEEI